jgi:hypothetical protein
MISVICVYNDDECLERCLLSSLRGQTARHELVAVDNRDGRFRGAAEALNWGARRATGGWLMFVHQDISLLSPDWLARAEEILGRGAPSGWVGIAGMTEDGNFRGFLLDRAQLLGAPFAEPAEVQTLDECVLIRRRQEEGHAYFDEGMPGWHAYGVDACCRALREGQKNYVISLPVRHDSRSSNVEGLEEAHLRVWREHGDALGRIATTCGLLPDTYGFAGGPRRGRLATFAAWVGAYGLPTLGEWVSAKLLRRCGFSVKSDNSLGPTLESLTEGEPLVASLHRQLPHGPIEAGAFVSQPRRRRRVVHFFDGLEPQAPRSDCVVVLPDLGGDLVRDPRALRQLAVGVRRLTLCFSLRDLVRRPALWRLARDSAAARTLVLRSDRSVYYDTLLSPVVVIDLRRGGEAG